LGITAQGMPLGSFMTPLLVTALVPCLGWRHAFQVLALCTFVLLVPLAFIVLRNLPGEETPNALGSPLVSDAVNPASRPTRSLLCARDFWIISLSFGALLGACQPVLYNLGSYANDLSVSQRSAAFIASTGAIAVGAANSSRSLLAGFLLTTLGIGSFVPLLRAEERVSPAGACRRGMYRS
jgi:MFS family permease